MSTHLLKQWASDPSLSAEDSQLLRQSADQIDALGDRVLDLKQACQDMISIIVRHLGDDLHYPSDAEALAKAKKLVRWEEHPDATAPSGVSDNG
ncbi:hypothetical protein IB238_05475 [Rhizobium sp. ARZ01]|uniref:hypothetical protein n=1 Tax=Rhizobium sp. ARZ01 TaxID=2769313 RepID=UPI00178252A8|nr:hypothetical protein [Rhizobium sp. ARZ01]MBD9372079.1 hypothetical protein [Rhizobium sp. ARZ01]